MIKLKKGSPLANSPAASLVANTSRIR